MSSKGSEGGDTTAPSAPPDVLARRFHETYERLAPSFGYETRPESAKPWEEVPERNRALMVAVCAEIFGARVPAPSGERERVVEKLYAAIEAAGEEGEVRLSTYEAACIIACVRAGSPQESDE